MDQEQLPVPPGLTPAQVARIPDHVAKWQAIGLSTERVNRERAEMAVRQAYAQAGQAEPTIHWHESPFAAIPRQYLFAQSEDAQSLAVRFFTTLIAPLHNSLRIANNATDKAVRHYLFEAVRAQIENAVYVSVGARISKLFPFEFPALQHAAGTTGLLMYYHEVLHYDLDPELPALVALVCNSDLWIPDSTVSHLTDRPVHIHLDENGELSSDPARQPAVLYRDGWGVWVSPDGNTQARQEE